MLPRGRRGAHGWPRLPKRSAVKPLLAKQQLRRCHKFCAFLSGRVWGMGMSLRLQGEDDR